MRNEEIGQAFQFGHEATIRNVLEPNWWETTEAQDEQQHVADEVLRLDKERREAGEDEEEDEEMETKENGKKETKPDLDEKKPTVRTRVRDKRDTILLRPYADLDGQLQFKPEEVAQFKSMGIAPRQLLCALSLTAS